MSPPSLRALGLVSEVNEDATTNRYVREREWAWELALAVFLCVLGLVIVAYLFTSGQDRPLPAARGQRAVGARRV